MGFLDFFRRNRRRPPIDDSQLKARIRAEQGKVRCHHYSFAHQALPAIARQDPLRCLGVLASEHARPFLQAVLDSVIEVCRETEPSAELDFTVNDVHVHKVRVGNYPCAVIEMPPPRGITEVYFTAIVVLHDLERARGDDDDRGPSAPAAMRYVTLERGVSEDGGVRTVLCEWDERGHSNFGDGPPPTLEAFVGAVEQMVTGRADGPALRSKHG